ncbi:MAG: error-prone DNA polymerase [Deltaproteobacteria bacterium]|nr:error-prone DNA polymerase [Deltaproteobacteria bacterium]
MGSTTEYPEPVELCCRSAFSFLDGASDPEQLAERAASLGYVAVALADFGGVYGAPRFHQAMRKHGLRAIVGAELDVAGEGAPPSTTTTTTNTAPGSRIALLVRTREGYRNLCRLLTRGHAGRPKGACVVSFDELAEHAAGLTALVGREAALQDERTLDRLVAILPGELRLAIARHRLRDEERDNRALVELARRRRLPLVATNRPRYATPDRAPLFDVLTCLRLGTTLAAAGRRLRPDAERYLRPPEELAALFSDLPDALAEAADLGRRCAFTLEDLGYRFPEHPLPPGRTADDELRARVRAGARERYRPLAARHRAQLEHELAVIAKLGLAGYFLVVHDIVRFCRAEGILAQGRGSAANSAVCYVLGITAVDPVGMELLFERFLSEERGEWPDIDLDLPSGERRERVIQHVFARYGPHGAAMTANVITYRGRSAVREVGKVLELPADAIDRTAKLFHGWGPFPVVLRDELAARARDAGLPDDRRTALFLELCAQLHGLPRHLGQHSGGMVVAGGRLDEVVPLEPAAMPGRTVIQWDKDDCADLGIIKVDLLGLGMLRALELAVPLVREHEGVTLDLAHLPQDDPRTYAMIRRADTVGVFQIESRAQMATLPRMRPERFYDLVVEVALIRPGPIVGKMVSPYLERRAGRQPVAVPHPSLEPILRRTLGVPLFQEQLMRVAMVAAGFTGGEAEELRRALGSKRSAERMAAIERKLRAGMAARGIAPEAVDEIVRGIAGFALYGFPESHAASFALIAYASAYLKAHHPAAFTCALLNAWPLGFYHPATLVKDLQRHGVPVRPIDAARSEWDCTLERSSRGPALRLGLRWVHGLRAAAARRIVEERAAAPFVSAGDLARRAGLHADELDTLAELGALGCFGLERREALWQVGRLARGDGPLWDGGEGERDGEPCPLPRMTTAERTRADYEASGLTAGVHPLGLHRLALTRAGVLRATELAERPDGSRVAVAGLVVVRQRPGTAKGFFFLTLEDETGLANVVVTPARYEADRVLLVSAPALVVEGPLQRRDGVLTVQGVRFRALGAGGVPEVSRDFR